jgi:SAM-dependent methyltransferase
VSAVDERNAAFWDELCGSGLARAVGATDGSPESLARFDAAYRRLYPYLLGYFPREEIEGRRLLDIGLGYGTLGQELAQRGAEYHGLDIAAGPVAMLRSRLARVEGADPARVQQGSVLSLPFDDASFDHVVSIGCLHHTGDLAGALGEVRRVLRPGGRLVLMVYNRHSLRQLLLRGHARLRRGPAADEAMRAAYDANGDGQAAPHTDFVTRSELRGLLWGFRDVRIERRNVDPVPRMPLRTREMLIRAGVDRLVGLDLYAIARR